MREVRMEVPDCTKVDPTGYPLAALVVVLVGQFALRILLLVVAVEFDHMLVEHCGEAPSEPMGHEVELRCY